MLGELREMQARTIIEPSTSECMVHSNCGGGKEREEVAAVCRPQAAEQHHTCRCIPNAKN